MSNQLRRKVWQVNERALQVVLDWTLKGLPLRLDALKHKVCEYPPEDADICRVWYDFPSRTIMVEFSHPSWDEVPPGHEAPVVNSCVQLVASNELPTLRAFTKLVKYSPMGTVPTGVRHKAAQLMIDYNIP